MGLPIISKKHGKKKIKGSKNKNYHKFGGFNDLSPSFTSSHKPSHMVPQNINQHLDECLNKFSNNGININKEQYLQQNKNLNPNGLKILEGVDKLKGFKEEFRSLQNNKNSTNDSESTEKNQQKININTTPTNNLSVQLKKNLFGNKKTFWSPALESRKIDRSKKSEKEKKDKDSPKESQENKNTGSSDKDSVKTSEPQSCSRRINNFKTRREIEFFLARSLKMLRTSDNLSKINTLAVKRKCGKESSEKWMEKDRFQFTRHKIFKHQALSKTDSEIARQINSLLGNINENKQLFVRLLSCRTNERMEIFKMHYWHLFSKDLIRSVRGKTTGTFHLVSMGLLLNKTDFQAYVVRNRDENCLNLPILINIFCTSTCFEIKTIASSYEKIYRRKLVCDIENEADFSLQSLLIGLMNCERETKTEFDKDHTLKIADRIFIQPGSIATNPSLLVPLCCSKSYEEIRYIYKYIKNVSGELNKSFFNEKPKTLYNEGIKIIFKFSSNKKKYFSRELVNCMIAKDVDKFIMLYFKKPKDELKSILREYLLENNRSFLDNLGNIVDKDNSYIVDLITSLIRY